MRIAAMVAVLVCAPPAQAQPALDEAERTIAAYDRNEGVRWAQDLRSREDSARSLYLLARAYERVDPRAAFRFYRRALERDPDRELRLRIAHGMDRARRGFGVVRLELPYADTRVTVDGRVAEREAGGRLLFLLPGTYVIATADLADSISVEGGRFLDVRLVREDPRGQPIPLHEEGPWFAGNLFMGGMGLAGVLAFSAWSQEREAQTSSAASIEHDYAELELGASYGTLIAAMVHLMAGAVLHIHWAPAPLALQVAALATLVMSAVAVGVVAGAGLVPERDALAAAGFLFGFASVTAGNLFFGVPDWDPTSGLGLAGIVRGVIEAGLSGVLFALAGTRGDDAQAAALERQAIGSALVALALTGISTTIFTQSRGAAWLFGRHGVQARIGPGGVSLTGSF